MHVSIPIRAECKEANVLDVRFFCAPTEPVERLRRAVPDLIDLEATR